MASYNDFIGFSFQPIINGVPQQEKHSSELGIVRVSDGSRYSENLLPTMRNETVEVPGGDGTYWWKTDYTQTSFTISVAFDSLTEVQRREIIRLFNGKNLGYLVFDELPFKKYIVKTDGTPNIKYICFTEEGGRVYKGEGAFNFIAYYPYAISVHKFLDEYVGDRYSNKSEWAERSGMKASQTVGNITYDNPNTTIQVFNAGDIDTAPKLYYPIADNGSLVVKIDSGTANEHPIRFANLAAAGSDTHIMIDMSTHLVEGCTLSNGVYTRTGNLYNKYLTLEDFFVIPADGARHTITQNTSASCTKIEYDYLYF